MMLSMGWCVNYVQMDILFLSPVRRGREGEREWVWGGDNNGVVIFDDAGV